MLSASYGKYSGTRISIVDATENGYEQTISSGLTTDKANGLYNYNYYYWLACPSSYDSNFVRIVNYSSACVNSGNYSSSSGIRPVVCLKPDVILTKSSAGNTFTIN